MLRKTLIGACLLAFIPAAQPGVAASLEGNAAIADMSAKKKKPRSQRYVRQPAPPVYGGYWFRDPSLGPDGRPYRNPYPPGTCTTDLGYGRFASCDAERK